MNGHRSDEARKARVSAIAFAVAACATGLGVSLPACEAHDPCLLAEGCGKTCETDDDCDDSNLGDDGLSCQALPGMIGQNLCTRPCSNSADCSCVCVDSPEVGWCQIGQGGFSPPWACRVDMPDAATACRAVCDWYVGCGCTNWGRCYEACDGWIAAFPGCAAELDEVLLCAYRHPDPCEDEGLYAAERCGTPIAELETCSGQPFGMFVPYEYCY